jgi:hypothetical protein
MEIATAFRQGTCALPLNIPAFEQKPPPINRQLGLRTLAGNLHFRSDPL